MPSQRPSPPTALPLLLACAPFALAILSTFALVLIVGDRFPRQLAPGERLWPHGLGWTAAIGAVVAWALTRETADPRLLRALLGLCILTSLMAWPVWTLGLMPSLNGARVGTVQTTPMKLARLQTTPMSKGRGLHHWAHLEPAGSDPALARGRYFVDEAAHERWQRGGTRVVEVDHAVGLLDARVVLALR